jgi:thymidylate synthase
LVDNNCNIWNGDAYKNYEINFRDEPPYTPSKAIWTQEEFINKIKTDDEFAKKWGDLGPIYGKQWRSWHTGWDVVEDKSKEAGVRRIEYGIDQIQNLINELKTDPDSRRLMVNAWNVGELGPLYGKQWRSWGRKNVVNYDLENVKSSDKVKVMDLIRDGGDYSKYDVKVTYQNNSIDQISILINDLKTNPDSRRLMVNAWNVGELGKIYGHGWRNWNGKSNDELYEDYLKKVKQPQTKSVQ